MHSFSLINLLSLKRSLTGLFSSESVSLHLWGKINGLDKRYNYWVAIPTKFYMDPSFSYQIIIVWNISISAYMVSPVKKYDPVFAASLRYSQNSNKSVNLKRKQPFKYGLVSFEWNTIQIQICFSHKTTYHQLRWENNDKYKYKNKITNLTIIIAK